MISRRVLCLIACFIASLPLTPTFAQTEAAFFKGKQINLYIGYEAGGGYDLFARNIARHIPPHIPGNPTIVPLNMPGASSMVLGNHLAKVAPKDGTAFGAVNSALLPSTGA